MALLSFTPSEIMIAAWLFVMGGAIGSFLNVVIYRMPAGLSINRPASHCPTCKHPIRWYDNVPILGWIILRGRCRDCGEPFSIRYPLVEAAMAGLFLAVGLAEGISGGANLPPRPEIVGSEVLSFSLSNVQLAGLVAWHLLLLSTLTAAAMIEFDGHRPPVRLFGTAAVVGLLAPAVWPFLHPVPVARALDGVSAGLTDSLAGLAAGLLVGWAVAHLVGPTQRRGLLAASACTGLYLGWQAALVLAVLAAVMILMTRPLPRLKGLAATAWLAVGSLVWILWWNRLTEWFGLLRYPSP